MITVTNLSKSYGSQILFSDLSFNINKDEKIGLVGRNGYGKTTLFQLLTGDITPDSGSISIPKDYRIGYLRQHIKFSRETVLREGCGSLPAEESTCEWKVKKILFGLGFCENDLNTHPAKLSSGYQIRLNLAKVIISAPDLLLLDEPNNYLDIVSIRWLMGFLRCWKSEIMLITHDRNFMDNVTTHTMIIHRRKVRKIEGSTSKLYGQIAREEAVYEKTRLNDEKKRKKTEIFIKRFRAKARLGGLVQSRVKCLEKQQKFEQLEKIESLDFYFNPKAFNAGVMLEAENIGFAYETSRLIINDFTVDIGKRDRICVIGKNGKGKTTLLKILAGVLSPSIGIIRRHPELKTGYYAHENISRLSEYKTVLEEITGENMDGSQQKARDVCGTLMFSGDAALKEIAVLSGGERNRVLIGKLLMTPCHLLLLDEPTNHLDMESCDALAEAIDAFEGSVVMVTHNEMFLKNLATRLVVFDREKITLYEGSYENFLEDIGWEGEETQKFQNNKWTEQNNNNPKVASKQELKKKKALIRQERAVILKPLHEEITRIECKIERMENEFDTNTKCLVKAAEEGNVDEITDLSRKDHLLRKDIDSLYEKLYEISQKYDEESLKFNKKLSVLDD